MSKNGLTHRMHVPGVSARAPYIPSEPEIERYIEQSFVKEDVAEMTREQLVENKMECQRVIPLLKSAEARARRAGWERSTGTSGFWLDRVGDAIRRWAGRQYASDMELIKRNEAKRLAAKEDMYKQLAEAKAACRRLAARVEFLEAQDKPPTDRSAKWAQAFVDTARLVLAEQTFAKLAERAHGLVKSRREAPLAEASAPAEEAGK